MASVRELLKIAPLNKGKLLAGEAGLEKELKTATVIEIPYAEDFLEEDLAALTSFYAIIDDVKQQVEVVKLLASHKVSALFLFNVGRKNCLQEISQELIDACNEVALPLIVMPISSSYYSVLYAIMNHVLDDEMNKLTDTLHIYNSFNNKLLDPNNSYVSFLNTLSAIMKTDILFFDHNNSLKYKSKGIDQLYIDAKTISRLKKALPKDISQSHDPYLYTVNSTPFVITPVVQNKLYYGSIIICNMETPLDRLAKLALTQTIKALSVSILSYDKLDEYAEKQRSNFILDLLLGNISNRGLMAKQAKQLNLNIDKLTGLMILEPFHINQLKKKKDLKRSRIIFDQAKELLNEELVVMHEPSKQIVVLTYANSPEDHLLSKAETLKNLLAKLYIDISVGISPAFSDFGEISEAFNKARTTLIIANRLYEAPAITTFSQISIYSLLLFEGNSKEALDLIRTCLSPVINYDIENETNLSETFNLLLKYNLSTAKVAKDLFIHKNTVLQRKNKIASLYSTDPFSDEERHKYALAFLIKKINNL